MSSEMADKLLRGLKVHRLKLKGSWNKRYTTP